jgi:RNA polymerase sigma factor (sigma-70 family)
MGTRRVNEVIRQLRKTVLTDGQLLEDYVCRREEAALAALVQRHGPMVWGVCRRVLRNYHDAEDAFQATFLVLVRKAASITSRELLANWLYGVAYQTARKARATAAKRRQRERQVADMPEPSAGPPDLWQDLQPLLDQELNGLPAKYRLPVVLCDLQGKSRKEAARQLRCPEGTVAGRLARARRLLAKRLARHGLAVSGGALAAVLSQEAASAMPTAVAMSTIKAANLYPAGLISAEVAALTEGVLKAMLLTRLKIMLGTLLVVCLVATTAAGLAYSRAAEEPNEKPQPGLADEVRMLRAEVGRLRKESAELKQRTRKLVVKVYPVAGLTQTEVAVGTEAQSLIRVIINSVEPTSWNQAGGEGSVEYFPDGGSLVIRQDADIHKQVQDLLELLRKCKKEQEKGGM